MKAHLGEYYVSELLQSESCLLFLVLFIHTIVVHALHFQERYKGVSGWR